MSCVIVMGERCSTRPPAPTSNCLDNLSLSASCFSPGPASPASHLQAVLMKLCLCAHFTVGVRWPVFFNFFCLLKSGIICAEHDGWLRASSPVITRLVYIRRVKRKRAVKENKDGWVFGGLRVTVKTQIERLAFPRNVTHISMKMSFSSWQNKTNQEQKKRPHTETSLWVNQGKVVYSSSWPSGSMKWKAITAHCFVIRS